MRVIVPLPLPSKNNQHEIFFDRGFWNAINDIVVGMKKYTKKPLYWIGSPKIIKDMQMAIGYCALLSLPQDTLGPVRVDIWVSDKLDCDNAAKIVLDAIQSSGRLKNDKQVKILHVEKLDIANSRFWFDITPLDGDLACQPPAGEEIGPGQLPSPGGGY